MADLLKSQAHIINQIFSFKNSASLKCAVELGIADVIGNHGKPMSLSDLTAALPINPSKAQYTHRLMGILVNSGFFTEQKNPKLAYSLTAAGRLLLKDEPMNQRAMVLMALDPVMIKPWNSLSNWFRNEDPSCFYTAHGKNFWDYNGEEPRLRNLFNEAMAADSTLIAEVLITELKFVFSGLRFIVEVGGGTGTVSVAIAKNLPNLKCTVFDLPHVIDEVREPKPILDNLEFFAGDMFDQIPHADAILLKWILHDWDDENCLKILKNCKKVIPEREKGGKVMMIDMVVEQEMMIIDEEEYSVEEAMDMQMLVLFSSKERNEKEWATLFWDSGFSDYKIFPHVLGSTRCLIEVYP